MVIEKGIADKKIIVLFEFAFVQLKLMTISITFVLFLKIVNNNYFLRKTKCHIGRKMSTLLGSKIVPTPHVINVG